MKTALILTLRIVNNRAASKNRNIGTGIDIITLKKIISTY